MVPGNKAYIEHIPALQTMKLNILFELSDLNDFSFAIFCVCGGRLVQVPSMQTVVMMLSVVERKCTYGTTVLEILCFRIITG